MKDWLYLGHALIVWGGGIWQIIHVFKTKSVEDIALAWIACLLVSEMMALPRAVRSEYWVWGLCHIVGSILLTILLVGVLIYR